MNPLPTPRQTRVAVQWLASRETTSDRVKRVLLRAIESVRTAQPHGRRSAADGTFRIMSPNAQNITSAAQALIVTVHGKAPDVTATESALSHQWQAGDDEGVRSRKFPLWWLFAGAIAGFLACSLLGH